MNENAKPGVSIPGYQPVEKVGNTPSYGVWIRALQTRMNRRVLLKVLPPGAGKLTEFFAREIAAAVRIEGRGMLAVIDEGSAGEVRYLVLDEAGATPLGPSTPRVSPQRWFEFAQKLEDLYRLAESNDTVLAPIAPTAFRSLPNGELVLGDLGWLVPFGDRLPNLDTIPEDLRGAAVSAHNRHFLAASLTSLAKALGTSVPKPLRLAATALGESESAEQCLPTERVFSGQVARGGGVPLIVQIIFGACIVAGGAWIAQKLIDPAPSTVVESGDDEPVDGEPEKTDPDPSDDNPEEDARLAWRAAEQEAENQFLGAFDKISLDQVQDLLAREVPIARGIRLSLSELVDNHGNTQSAALASLILRHSWVSDRLRLALAWEPHRNEMTAHMAAGHVTDADRSATAAARALGRRPQADQEMFRGDDWLGWGPLSTESVERGDQSDARARLLALIQGQLSAAESRLARVDRGEEPHAALEEWQARIEQEGRKNRQELTKTVERLREERIFQRMLDAITEGKDGLLLSDRSWADTLATEIEAQGRRHSTAKQELFDACRDVFVLCGGAPGADDAVSDWDAALARLASAKPADEFPRLIAEYERWSSRLGQAKSAVDQLSEALEVRRRSGSKETYRTLSDEPRGSVRSVTAGTSFVLKVDGRREDRTLPFRELTIATLQSIEPGPDVATWLLALFFMGDLERSVREASQLSSSPEWLVDARALSAKRFEKQFEQLISRGDAAYASGQFEASGQIARTVIADYPESTWTVIRSTKLEPWIDAQLTQSGPAKAFHNYESLEWDPATRTLTVQYDFGEPGAKEDWTQIRLERTHLVKEDKGSVIVRGSAFLSPDGSTNLFTETLEAEMQCEPLNADAPNLNLVLWSGRPKRRVARGLLGGLGTYPLDMARAVFGDGSRGSVILPANVLGLVADLEDGELAERLLAIEDGPKVRAKSKLTVFVSDNGKEAVLARKSSSQFGKDVSGSDRWSGESPGAKPGRGTVEIRTYESAVEVRKIRVKGRLTQAWWDQWRLARVAEAFQ